MNPFRSAALAAALAAAPLHAQAADSIACPHGRADDEGLVISSSVLAHPTRVASVMDTVLEETGYTVLRSPQAEGRWNVEPRFTWHAGEKELVDGGPKHPGVALSVHSEARGDSTHVTVGARVICGTAAGAKAEPLTALELMAAAAVTSAFTERLDTLRARGVALAEPVARPGFTLTIPPALAGFAFQSRHDYEDARMGTSARFAREDGLSADVYVFPGPPADSSCPQSCADRYVEQETTGFADLLPELVRRGQLRGASVVATEAVRRPEGAAWRAGRHLTARVEVGGETRESHFYLFLFPGYQVKVRATFPPSDERRQAVRALVDDALVQFARQP